MVLHFVLPYSSDNETPVRPAPAVSQPSSHVLGGKAQGNH